MEIKQRIEKISWIIIGLIAMELTLFFGMSLCVILIKFLLFSRFYP